MEARNRNLPDWFTYIRTRQVTLPRFQRQVAWGHAEVAGLLTTVLRGLPAGASLVLEVGDAEKFPSRTMVDAPENGERVKEQLLDGQQRLTALWRSLHDKYPDRTYLVGFEDDPHRSGQKLPYVFGQSRWTKKEARYPMWVDQPYWCWQKGFIPLRLLMPADIQPEIDAWIEEAIKEATGDRLAAYKRLSQLIGALRTSVREFNLPYLSLPVTTERDVALDVFIKMNTSSVRLSAYDIVVAMVESETGKSLHEHVADLQTKAPRISAYADLASLVLDVVALRQDRMPSQAGYQGTNFKAMIDEWDAVAQGISSVVQWLEDECVYDMQRLPSYPPLPVLAALHEHLPHLPDQLGNARILLRKYLWRSFLTERYEQSTSSNALQDFRALRDCLKGCKSEKDVPIFNEDLYPIPGADQIQLAPWPKAKTILGRGLLAMQLKCGAEDIADGARASVHTITSKTNPREYHHLFPDAMLTEVAALDEGLIYRAVNCALITWRTNRTISAKHPVRYLQERTKNSVLGIEELQRRLRTHLIPFAEMNVGNYSQLGVEEAKAAARADYQDFLQARSELLARGAQLLCQGRPLELSQVFTDDGHT